MTHDKQTVTKLVFNIAQVRLGHGGPDNGHLFQDLRLSPLKRLEICLRLEKEFRLKMDDEKYFQAQCMEDIVVLVMALCEAKQVSR